MQNILNTPFQFSCGATFKNRVVKAAMTERLCHSDHLPNKQHIQLYNHWSRNGAAMLLSGNIMVDRRYLESTGNVVVEKDTSIEAFKKWTSTVSKYDCHFWAQISHAGRQSSKFSTRKSVSASDVQLKKMGLFSRPTPLTEIGIEDVINRFVHTAEFCKKAGFTGVQFHAAHGYLLNQFLSPLTNKRSDKWGGSLDNRARILYYIIDKSRKKLGSAFPISVKLNSADFQRGGFDEEDSKRVIKALEERGIDLLEISGGTYEQSAMMGIGMKESTRSREAYFLEFASNLRRECQIPLMVTGGFRSLVASEAALQKNELDVIGYARPFLMSDRFPMGFLDGTCDKVEEPIINILDPKNKDAAEAGFYDLQIERIANNKPLKHNYPGWQVALHLPKKEMRMGFRNWLLR